MHSLRTTRVREFGLALRMAALLVLTLGGPQSGAWAGADAGAGVAAGGVTHRLAGMARVDAGWFKPAFRLPGEATQIPVGAFLLDVAPITNAEFLEFVRANPQWRRSRVPRLFADPSYLQHWSEDLQFDPVWSRKPVVFVSWFAAKAYARWQGKRLPTVAEWEYAANASPTRRDGENDSVHQQAILRWYVTPTPSLPPDLHPSATNLFGVHDLHGCVWEWVADFNSAMVTGDARGDTGLDRQLFCGAGGLGARNPSDFPAFMRYGFRSSLKAGYTVHNLGFRCAKDL